MKKEIAEKWVAALRSRDYKQGKHELRFDENFCCLGVLCDLAEKEGITKFVYYPNGREGGYVDSSGVIWSAGVPSIVQRWSGLYNSLGGNSTGGYAPNLASLNDHSGFTFEQIADIIEKEYENL